MVIPEGMTEKEVVDTILRIAKRLAPKYTFGHYDTIDIIQEAFIIGMDGLKRYNSKHPLENFLYRHIRNRLNTFKRDNYVRLEKCPDCGGNSEAYCAKCYEITQKQSSRKNIAEPVSLHEIGDNNSHSMWCKFDFTNELELGEILCLIDEKLDMSLRADYLRLRDEVSIPKQRKEKVIAAIMKILEENGYDF